MLTDIELAEIREHQQEAAIDCASNRVPRYKFWMERYKNEVKRLLETVEELREQYAGYKYKIYEEQQQNKVLRKALELSVKEVAKAHSWLADDEHLFESEYYIEQARKEND
jgi:hypothetical protein